MVNKQTKLNPRAYYQSFVYTCFGLTQFCMVYGVQRGGWGGSYIAQSLCNRIALGWAMQVGAGDGRMVDLCTKASK